jgi:hypothetical protein
MYDRLDPGFTASRLGKLFYRYEQAHIEAQRQDARLGEMDEPSGFYVRRVKELWATAQVARQEFVAAVAGQFPEADPLSVAVRRLREWNEGGEACQFPLGYGPDALDFQKDLRAVLSMLTERSAERLRALALIARLHNDAVLSEGQICTALEMDRIEFRAMVDQLDPNRAEVPEKAWP